MMKIIFIFILSLSILSAQEKIHSFDIKLNIPFFSQASLQNGLEESIFYDNLIKGNPIHYKKEYYNTRWEDSDSSYSLFSIIYFQNKQNWFLGFKSKDFNKKYFYHRFYLNDDMENLYRYQKSQASFSFSYYDILYGKKWTYKGFSFLPYLTIRSHHFTLNQSSVPFPIHTNRKTNRYINEFPFLKTNLIDEFFVYGPANFLAFDFLSQLPIEKFSRKSKGYNTNLAYRIEKNFSNSINLFLEMSFYLFSIDQKYGQNDFLSYEKTSDKSYDYERSKLKWDIKSLNYEIGLEYNIYENLNLLAQLSHDVFENIYSNYKGFHIQKTEDKTKVLGEEIFTNSLFYNKAYRNDSSNFSLGIKFKIS